MTPSQWKEVEERLSHPYGRAVLQADGHRVVAEVRPYKGLRYCVAVFIDGVIDWKWVDGKHAPARKFWRERKHYLYSAAKRAEAAKQAKKRGMSAGLRQWWADQAEAHFIQFDPLWPNAKALCRHLRKTCAEVSVVEESAGLLCEAS
jgi:hypothetical protein